MEQHLGKALRSQVRLLYRIRVSQLLRFSNLWPHTVFSVTGHCGLYFYGCIEMYWEPT